VVITCERAGVKHIVAKNFTFTDTTSVNLVSL